MILHISLANKILFRQVLWMTHKPNQFHCLPHMSSNYFLVLGQSKSSFCLSLCFQEMIFPSFSRKSSWWKNASTTTLWPTLGATSGKSQQKITLLFSFLVVYNPELSALPQSVYCETLTKFKYRHQKRFLTICKMTVSAFHYFVTLQRETMTQRFQPESLLQWPGAAFMFYRGMFFF